MACQGVPVSFAVGISLVLCDWHWAYLLTMNIHSHEESLNSSVDKLNNSCTSSRVSIPPHGSHFVPHLTGLLGRFRSTNRCRRKEE
jgi:hypothetical protein